MLHAGNPDRQGEAGGYELLLNPWARNAGLHAMSTSFAYGVEAMQIINPREMIPIHYNDYEVFKSPLEDFKSAVRAAGLEDRVRYLSHGETYEFETRSARGWTEPR